MASSDTADRSVLGSGDTAYQDEARQAAMEEVGEDAYLADPMTHWTAQHGPMPDTGTAAALGPQRYLEEQLPDPAVAVASGIAPQQIPEYLVISDEDAWDHPKGPEPGEQVRLLKGEAVNQRMLTDTPTSDSENFVLTSAALREAQEAGNEDYPSGGGEDGDLNSMSKAELVDMAREQGVEGYSSMNKAELVEALGGE